MRRLLAVLLLVAAPAAAAPPDAVTRRYTRPGAPHATLVAGRLTAPSARPPREIASAYLATRPEPIAGVDPADLVLSRELALPRAGALVRFEQHAAGLPVVGGDVRVRVDAAGRVRWIASSARPLPAGFDATPRVAPSAALAAARTAGATAGDARSTLVIFRNGERAAPALAWQIELAGDARALVPATRVFVDARTGRVLAAWPLEAELGQANVFTTSPTVTPNLSQVDLSASLDPGATFLDGPDFAGYSCIDDGSCVTVAVNGTPTPVHGCGFTRRAAADANGDFLYMRPAADTDQTDAFAEVQIFFHAAQVLDFFRSLGLPNLRQHPMRVVANTLIADYSVLSNVVCTGMPPAPPAGHPLGALQNAAYFHASADGTFPTEDMLIFGQGKLVDFAYDGDVVYHEMGHAMHFTQAPNYARAVQDATGLDLTPHGTYEGMADYFALALTDDPELGEYTGVEFGSAPDAGLRTALNTKKCPDDLWGEEHQDGEPWMGALWDARSALAAGDRAQFDAAVFTMISGLDVGDTPIGDEPALLAAEVEARLGQAARDTVSAALAARGWDDCNGRVFPLPDQARKDVLFVRGTDYLKQDTQVPSLLQFQISVPAAASSFFLSWQNAIRPGSLVPQIFIDPDVHVIVKRDAPIVWTWDASGAHHDGEDLGALSLGNGVAGQATLPGASLPAGTWYVQLANAGGSYILVGLAISTIAAPTPDAGPAADASAPDAGTTGGDGGGCGCRAGGAPRSGAPGLAALAALALVTSAHRRASKRAHARRRSLR
jgi:hypothetical protein